MSETADYINHGFGRTIFRLPKQIEGDLAKLLADLAGGSRYSVPGTEPQCGHGLVAGNRRSDPHDRIPSLEMRAFQAGPGPTRVRLFSAFEELQALQTVDPATVNLKRQEST